MDTIETIKKLYDEHCLTDDFRIGIFPKWLTWDMVENMVQDKTLIKIFYGVETLGHCEYKVSESMQAEIKTFARRYPPINDPFYQQFNDPIRAYWNLPSAYYHFMDDLDIPYPDDNDLDYRNYAWKDAHGQILTDKERRIAQYNAKRSARITRLQQRAQRLESEGESHIARARSMAEVIPFGQPILIGHHSEKRDRNYRAKIHGNFDKGFTALKQAEELKSRAESAAENKAIFSDDPEATDKISEKLASLEALQKKMKDTNKAIKKKDHAALVAMGYTAEEATNWLTKPLPYVHGLGYPAYALSNNNANIRRLKQRIQEVEAKQNAETVTKEINGIKIEFNPQENRVKMFFGARVPKEIYNQLKRAGFRHTPSQGDFTFTAFYNANAKYYAETIARAGGDGLEAELLRNPA